MTVAPASVRPATASGSLYTLSNIFGVVRISEGGVVSNVTCSVFSAVLPAASVERTTIAPESPVNVIRVLNAPDVSTTTAVPFTTTSPPTSVVPLTSNVRPVSTALSCGLAIPSTGATVSTSRPSEPTTLWWPCRSTA